MCNANEKDQMFTEFRKATQLRLHAFSLVTAQAHFYRVAELNSPSLPPPDNNVPGIGRK